MATIAALTSTANPGFAIGRNGATNPVVAADCSVSSAATGIKVTGRAASAGVDLAATSSGTDENLRIDAKGGGTIDIGTNSTGAIGLKRDTAITGKETITSANAAALAVGPNGATNPCLQVDGSTSSAATGLKVTGKAAAAGAALAVVSSGTNESLNIDAKGSGTIDLGNTSTGNINLKRNTAVTGTLAASGNVAINTDKFTVAASNGNTAVGGTLSATGNFAVATDKFTVAAASGDTAIAGDATVAGSLTIGATELTEANLISLLALLS